MEWKQWEGHVIDGQFVLRQYLGGSLHSGVFLTEAGGGSSQPAAIKLVAADPESEQSWLSRLHLAANLVHPGLLPVLHFGTGNIDGMRPVYVVMELGQEDLAQVIPARALSPDEARETLAAILEPLAYVHSQGFVHGRLVPANIVAVGEGVKISADQISPIGAPRDYLWAPDPNGPPEGSMTPAGDVWWLGMTLVEVLTQQTPRWDRRAGGDPEIPETLPLEFREIARRCLRADPQLRCSLADIGSALNLGPPAEPRPAAVQTSHLDRRSRGFPLTAIALAAAVIVVALLTGKKLLKPHPPAAPAPIAAVEKAPPPQQKPVPFPESPPARAARQPVAPAAPHRTTGTADRLSGPAVDHAIPEVPQQILNTVRGVVKVSVQVRVDSSGRVVDASLESRPGSRYFDRVSLAAAHRWKFQPAEGAGRGGERTGSIRFEFRRSGCTAHSAGVP